MRTSIGKAIPLMLAAALAGCAGGGGHGQGNDNLHYAVCRILAPLVSGGCAQYQPVSSTAAGSGGSGTSGSAQTSFAPARVAAPQPQPFTRWEEAVAPGAIADELGVFSYSYSVGTDGKLEVRTAPGNALPNDSEADVYLGNEAVKHVFSGYIGGGWQFDGRTLPNQPGLMFVSDISVPEERSSPFVDVPFFDVTNSPQPGTGRRWVGAVADPYRQGWSYQSFGVWNQLGSVVGGGSVHSSTFGAPTPASAVPATGTATFNGKLAASYVSPDGTGSLAAADVSVGVDFASRSLSFASSGTTITRDLSTATPAPDLDLSGTLTYAAGSANFSGSITNAGGTMQGTSVGRFYGPAAQELGGGFTVAAPGNATPEAFAGAYGAKR